MKGIGIEKFLRTVFINLCGCDNFDKFAKPLIQDEVDLQRVGDNYTTPFNIPYDLQAAFSGGETAFLKVFTPEEGLGPVFNNTGCVSCHPANGRSTPDLILIRFSIGDNLILIREVLNFKTKPFLMSLRNDANWCRQITTTSSPSFWYGTYRKYLR